MKVAVIGGGVAGIACAYLLQRRYQVDVLEAGAWLGGHTHTVVIAAGPDAGTPVDTGFIVFNGDTYPLLQRFLRELGVAWQRSDMSFGYYCERSGWAYGGHDLNTFFARRRQVYSPDFLRMALDLMRFNRRATLDLQRGTLSGRLREYLEGYSKSFVRHYILPLGAAIWSAPLEAILDFPAQTYVRFFANHGLLRVTRRPDWFTVSGGSHRYVQAFAQSFQGRILQPCTVHSLRHDAQGSWVNYGGEEHFYDRVVLATHADQALALLADPTPAEVATLGAWRYQPNLAVLHSDDSLLPPYPRARASWNYRRLQGSPSATLSYDMNRLQSLQTQRPYLVTLNPWKAIPAEKVVGQWTYHHPQYDEAAVASQAALPELQGQVHRYFCGSYHGYGFHEDALRSGVEVARLLGVTW